MSDELSTNIGSFQTGPQYEQPTIDSSQQTETERSAAAEPSSSTAAPPPPKPTIRQQRTNAVATDVFKAWPKANKDISMQDWLKTVIANPKEYSKILLEMHNALQAQLKDESQQKIIQEYMDNMTREFHKAIAEHSKPDVVPAPPHQ